MGERKDTRRELVAELETLLPTCGGMKARRVRAIIEAARRGDYHDYKSPHAMPKVVLVAALHEASLMSIANRVINGEFDEPADAADLAEMANELRNEPELRKLLNLPTPSKT